MKGVGHALKKKLVYSVLDLKMVYNKLMVLLKCILLAFLGQYLLIM